MELVLFLLVLILVATWVSAPLRQPGAGTAGTRAGAGRRRPGGQIATSPPATASQPPSQIQAVRGDTITRSEAGGGCSR